jgi:hypothetical protein
MNVSSNIGHKSCSVMIVRKDISEDTMHVSYSGCISVKKLFPHIIKYWILK